MKALGSATFQQTSFLTKNMSNQIHNQLHCFISQIGLVLKIIKRESVLIAAHQIKTVSPYYSGKKKQIKWLLWNPNMWPPFPGDQLLKWIFAVTLNVFGCRNTLHVSSLNSPLVNYIHTYNDTIHRQFTLLFLDCCLWLSHTFIIDLTFLINCSFPENPTKQQHLHTASPTACLFSISRTPLVFLVCSLVWNAQEEFLYLRNIK